MKILFISDLHYTSRPIDAYRWGLCSAVNTACKRYDVDQIIIPGDLTDAKDNHSSTVVNGIVRTIADWSMSVREVIIVPGNHDGIDSSNRYFHFLGLLPSVTYINEITEMTIDSQPFVFLPHTRTPLADWEDLDFTGKYVVAHVSVKGAVFENGITMEEGEVEADIFKKAKAAFSGDIHSRQSVGPLHYIGCPFRVRFNDSFQGGGIVLDTVTGKWEYIDFDFLKRHTFAFHELSALKAFLEDIRPGDQLKARIHLTQKNMHNWRELKESTKQLVADAGVELCGLELIKDFNDTIPFMTKTPTTKSFSFNFDTFCDEQKISKELQEVGKQIIQESVSG